MAADLEIPEIMTEVGRWYHEQQEDPSSLLPQKLPQALLDQVLKEAHAAFREKNVDRPLFRMVVGLLKVGPDRTFRATREEIVLGMNAYAFNVILEGLRRSGVVTFKHDFTVQDVLDFNYDRHIALTDFGRKAASSASDILKPIFNKNKD